MIEKLSTEKLTNLLKTLFVNRVECYCIQLAKGYSKINAPLTDGILEKHIIGEITVGSYQLDVNSFVKWLCFDLDPEKFTDPMLIAKKILEVTLEKVKNKEGEETPRIWESCIVLEASRYPDRSYHIWILFLIPIQAKIARWLGLRILEMANLNPKLIEVFPKQNEITPETPYGNFVKLPFGKHQVEQKYSKMLDFNSFEPVSLIELENKHGLSFLEKDIEKMASFNIKKSVQTVFEVPKTFKKLSNKDEEKSVCFLLKYWKPGFRNDLEISFLGMCIKEGVNYESAKRIISEVCTRSNTSVSETENALSKVDYHYDNRLNVNLKGRSGIQEVIETIIKKEREKNDT